jgi:hypothetical protein
VETINQAEKSFKIVIFPQKKLLPRESFFLEKNVFDLSNVCDIDAWWQGDQKRFGKATKMFQKSHDKKKMFSQAKILEEQSSQIQCTCSPPPQKKTALNYKEIVIPQLSNRKILKSI